MKIPHPTRWRRSPRREAFTLPEMMIVSSLLLLVVAGILIGNSFGMRMLGIIQPKLLAHEESMKLIRLLSSDIYEGKFVRIGNGDSSSFTSIVDDNPRQGNAIEIYGSNDTSEFTRYFHDSGDNTLKRMTNGGSGDVVASAIANDQIFTAEDFQGQVLTNEQPRVTVGAVLDFYELGGSGTPVGTNSYFTSYVLNIKVASGTR